MLILHSITKSYLSGTSSREVLKGVNLEVNPGDTVAIVGPSGSGKTSLLNIIASLDKADSGTVVFNKHNLLTMNSREQAGFRNREIGMVFQLHHLLPQCTLWENVLIPTIPLNDTSGKTSLRAEELLKRTGIWEQRHQKPSALSGGECQRAAVVRALINQPSLILADEPTGALDHQNALTLSNLLIELNQEQGTALIIVTHSTELASKMGKVYLLSEGILTKTDH
jgi:lipoprotein-releasing system ATP-binding protein